MNPVTTYNDERHEYEIDGVRVPSVTQILADLLPCWRASEWHLQRGRAVHACAAFVALGKPFTCDPQIAGQVAACERWFAEVKPEVLDVEQIVTSLRYRYCGRYDLFARIGGRDMIVDWKATITKSVPRQLAGYSMAYGETHKTQPVRHGVAVQLKEDGTYSMTEVYDLRKYIPKFLAHCASHHDRIECGSETEHGEQINVR